MEAEKGENADSLSKIRLFKASIKRYVCYSMHLKSLTLILNLFRQRLLCIDRHKWHQLFFQLASLNAQNDTLWSLDRIENHWTELLK